MYFELCAFFSQLTWQSVADVARGALCARRSRLVAPQSTRGRAAAPRERNARHALDALAETCAQ